MTNSQCRLTSARIRILRVIYALRRVGLPLERWGWRRFAYDFQTFIRMLPILKTDCDFAIPKQPGLGFPYACRQNTGSARGVGPVAQFRQKQTVFRESNTRSIRIMTGAEVNTENFCPDSFHTKKLCTRLSSNEVRF